MEREQFNALTAEDAHAHAEHERDELRQSLWLQLAREIAAGKGSTAGDLAPERADHLFHATGAVSTDDSHARLDESE
jgi:hypothetical protein